MDEIMGYRVTVKYDDSLTITVVDIWDFLNEHNVDVDDAPTSDT